MDEAASLWTRPKKRAGRKHEAETGRLRGSPSPGLGPASSRGDGGAPQPGGPDPGVGAAIGIGMATSHASEAIARQPEAKKDIRSTMLIGCALAEATAIYGLLVAIMLIFVASPDSKSIMGAAVAVVTGMGAGIGIGLATSRACDSIARQPEVKKDIRSTMLIGCALAEATAIYGLLVSIMLIFVV